MSVKACDQPSISLIAIDKPTMQDTSPHRHAVYYAPAEHSALAQRGAQWLGRCAQSRRAMQQPQFPAIAPENLRAWTAAATRYGWHATMKAPFTLKPHVEMDAIPEALRSLAQRKSVFTLPPLKLHLKGDYLALVPEASCNALQEFAFDCVRALHPLAKPLSDEQLAQRRRTPLTPSQDAMLVQWGYPFVGDEFQWHMTLTGSLKGLNESQLQNLREAALEWFAPVLNRAVALDAIAWFVEPNAGGDLYEAQRFSLAPA